MIRQATGQKDPVIALLKELGTEDGRRRAGRFFAEGEEIVRRAFDYGGHVDTLIVTERFSSDPKCAGLAGLARSVGAEIVTASEGLLAKVLEAKPTPECIAIVQRETAQMDAILSASRALVLMVEHGENADNLGMLLRSTDAAGVDGVVLAAATTDPFARRVVRGSRGAVFTTPICIQYDPVRVIAAARKAGLQVVATSARSDDAYTSVDYTRPTLVVVGNEHVGISDEVRKAADTVVYIPMRGRINSLNIAVAGSIVLYEALRQRA